MAGIKVWIEAFRLRTLPLAFSSIFMGAFLAEVYSVFRWDILVWSMLTTLFLQVLSNLANDYGDAQSGVDGADRKGPSRAVSSGLISREAMKRALIIASLLSLVSGIYLIWLAFGNQLTEVLIFLALGLGAIAAAINYTVGKRPYGYAGFGDFFVLVFFGIVGVAGSFYLYAVTFYPIILLPAFSCGFLSVGVLNVNNIRDIESDRKNGKNSIPVRLGRVKAVWYHWALLVAAMLASVVYVVLTGGHWFGYGFLLITPLLVSNIIAVNTKTSANKLDPYLKQLALITLLFVILFGLGQILFI